MENTPHKKSHAATVLIILLAIIVIALAAYAAMHPTVATIPPQDQINTETPSAPVAAVSGDTTNFVTASIAPGQTIASGPVVMTGTITGSYFFEATARGMLLDANRAVLASFPLTATSDWMTTSAVTFSASFDTTGIAQGPGFVRIANDNASGDAANDKFIDIPVVFQ